MESFAENPLTQPGLDRVFQNQVDARPEQLLQERLEIHVGVERLRLELDDEVEITVYARGALGSGSEQTQRSDAVAVNCRSVLFERAEDVAGGDIHGSRPFPWYPGRLLEFEWWSLPASSSRLLRVSGSA